MRDRGRRTWLIPLVAVALLLVGVPAAALTESAPERRLKEELGFVDRGCVPITSESPSWRAEPSLPDDRDEVRAAALDGKVYIAGGTSAVVDYGKPSSVPGVGEQVEVRSIDALTRFDPATGRYTELARLPEPLNHVGLVAYRGDLYLIGGHGRLVGGADPRATFLRYSPASDRWTPMPPMPTARGASAVGIIGDRLLVAGGMALGGRPVPTLEIFDFRSGRWSRGPDMESGREHVAGAVLDGKFYVIGGRNRRTDGLPTVERHDPRTERWEQLPPLSVPSGGLDAQGAGGGVLAIGGGNDRGGSVSAAVQRFDPRRGAWTQLPPMRTARHGFGSAYAGGRIYVFAGSPCPLFAATDLVESFEPPAGAHDPRRVLRASPPESVTRRSP